METHPHGTHENRTGNPVGRRRRQLFDPLLEGETFGDSLKITDQKGDSIVFVEQKMTHIKQKILRATSSVPMNRAGKEYRLYPRQAEHSGDTLRFTAECPVGSLTARWWPDPLFPDDIRVSLRFIPSRDGYFSLLAHSGHAARKGSAVGRRSRMVPGRPSPAPVPTA